MSLQELFQLNAQSSNGKNILCHTLMHVAWLVLHKIMAPLTVGVILDSTKYTYKQNIR
jgi:hypothetical protein